MSSAVTTRALRDGDLFAAADLLDAALGAGFVDRSALGGYVDGPRQHGIVATNETGTVIGVGLADRPVDFDAFVALMPGLEAAGRVLVTMPGIFPELAAGTVAILRSMAVALHVRGRGVGTALVRARSEAVIAAGATLLVSVGWVRGDTCPAAGPLQRAGFHAVGYLDGFWTWDASICGYTCPECTPVVCHCPATIFAATPGSLVRR